MTNPMDSNGNRLRLEEMYNKSTYHQKLNNMTKNIDHIPGEHDSKSWFKIMIKNGYFQLACVGVLGLIGFGYYTEWEYLMDDNWMITVILLGALTAIVVMGFIRFWNYLKGK